jgi:DeoR/GlpR family transcriptional regulator of sugar metabolism
MLAASRRSSIKELLTEKKSVTVLELAELFEVTDETIRKDLKALEQQGFLVKTYGGAFIQEGTLNDVLISVRSGAFVESKAIIGKLASKLISNGDSVFFDCSTTAYHIAQAVKDMRITVVTNSLTIGNCLASIKDINLILIGGSLNRTHMSFQGRDALQTISRYHMDKAFISARSLCIEHGITDSNDEVAEIRRTILDHANEVFIIADHTKFNKTSFVSIGNFERVSGIITDILPDERWINFLNGKRVAVYAP